MNTLRKIHQVWHGIKDKIRITLSHHPVLYAFIGGTGVIIFWRGVWHTVDYLMEYFTIGYKVSTTSFSQLPWWDGPLSIAFGVSLLVSTGLFVVSFIGTETIISGLRGEKQLTEKTEEEVKFEVKESVRIKKEIHEMDARVKHVEAMLAKKQNKDS